MSSPTMATSPGDSLAMSTEQQQQHHHQQQQPVSNASNDYSTTPENWAAGTHTVASLLVTSPRSSTPSALHPFSDAEEAFAADDNDDDASAYELCLGCGRHLSSEKLVFNCGLLPALAVLGMVGNCLCVAVFLRLRYHSVAKPMLLGLCVSNVLFLLATLLVNLPCVVGQVDLRAGHLLHVTMTPQVDPLRELLGRITVVMTLAIGVERCLAVTRPFKLRALCTVPRTRSTVLAIFLLVLALHAPAFFLYDVQHEAAAAAAAAAQENVTNARPSARAPPRPRLHRTGFYLDNKHALDFHFDYFLLVMLRVLPFACTCVCFGIVLVSLKRRLQCALPSIPKFGAFARAKGAGQQQRRGGAETEHGDLVLEERKLTRALLAVILLCVACELPGLVTRLYHVVHPDVRSLAFAVASDVSRLLTVFYSAVSFVVFMKMYKHFFVTFKTLSGLCN